jgi:hypothetical protein
MKSLVKYSTAEAKRTFISQDNLKFRTQFIYDIQLMYLVTLNI